MGHIGRDRWDMCWRTGYIGTEAGGTCVDGLGTLENRQVGHVLVDWAHWDRATEIDYVYVISEAQYQYNDSKAVQTLVIIIIIIIIIKIIIIINSFFKTLF